MRQILAAMRAPLSRDRVFERAGERPGLLATLREDWEANGRDWSRAGFRALAAYRFNHWRRERSAPVRRGLYLPARTLYRYARNRYGIELPPTATIGRRLRLPHQHGIVVHELAVIGDDCTIQQGVSLCFATDPSEAPTLGNGVQVGANAVIYGRVTVGDGASVGPNTVVTTDVPAGATLFAPPARVIGTSSE